MAPWSTHPASGAQVPEKDDAGLEVAPAREDVPRAEEDSGSEAEDGGDDAAAEDARADDDTAADHALLTSQEPVPPAEDAGAGEDVGGLLELPDPVAGRHTPAAHSSVRRHSSALLQRVTQAPSMQAWSPEQSEAALQAVLRSGQPESSSVTIRATTCAPRSRHHARTMLTS